MDAPMLAEESSIDDFWLILSASVKCALAPAMNANWWHNDEELENENTRADTGQLEPASSARHSKWYIRFLTSGTDTSYFMHQ